MVVVVCGWWSPRIIQWTKQICNEEGASETFAREWIFWQLRLCIAVMSEFLMTAVSRRLRCLKFTSCSTIPGVSITSGLLLSGFLHLGFISEDLLRVGDLLNQEEAQGPPRVGHIQAPIPPKILNVVSLFSLAKIREEDHKSTQFSNPLFLIRNPDNPYPLN